MASSRKRTSIIRKRKKSSAGGERKRQARSKGTTPTEAQLFGDEESN